MTQLKVNEGIIAAGNLHVCAVNSVYKERINNTHCYCSAKVLKPGRCFILLIYNTFNPAMTSILRDTFSANVAQH